MRDKICPKCQKYVATEAVQCQCGHSFDENIANRWSEGIREYTVPKTARAWLLVALAAPVTVLCFGFLAWLDWFNLSAIARSVLIGLLFVLPAASQVLPTFRKENGGCCLGCLVWMSVGVGVFIASGYWAFHTPLEDREVKTIPRLQSDVPITLGGIAVGSSRVSIEESKGPGRPTAYPTQPHPNAISLTWDDGTSAVFQDDEAVWVVSHSLEQSGEVLAQRGDSRKRILHLFDTSSYETPLRQYTFEDVDYSFEVVEGTKLNRIVGKSAKISILPQKPRESVNGICLGQFRSKLESPKSLNNNNWKVGDATVLVDEFDRVISVRGFSAEIDGKPLFRTGESSSALSKFGPNWRTKSFGPGQLTVHSSEGKISEIVWSFRSKDKAR